MATVTDDGRRAVPAARDRVAQGHRAEGPCDGGGESTERPGGVVTPRFRTPLAAELAR